MSFENFANLVPKFTVQGGVYPLCSLRRLAVAKQTLDPSKRGFCDAARELVSGFGGYAASRLGRRRSYSVLTTA